MQKPQYLDFDLWIQRTSNGFQAKGWDPQGREALVPFEKPWSNLEVENFRLRIGRPRQGMRRIQPPEIEAVKNFGGPLFTSLFHGELLSCFRASLSEARRKALGLRLRLRLEQAPELADLPWEYLYDEGLNRFLALSLSTPVVRYLELSERIRPLPVEGALRVLVMWSSPKDFEELDVEGEWQRLQTAMEGLVERGLIELYRLPEATIESLQRELRRRTYHIFHFIGHGGYLESSQEGLLIFEDEDGYGHPIRSESLGIFLHDHASLRLVTLNACEGARASQRDPFAGVAQTLIQQGLPAVVAMQSEITDRAAIVLAHEFYRALADGYPVDACLTEARKAVSATGNVEWGTPVLFLRAPDGTVFDVVGRTHSQIFPPNEPGELTQSIDRPATPEAVPAKTLATATVTVSQDLQKKSKPWEGRRIIAPQMLTTALGLGLLLLVGVTTSLGFRTSKEITQPATLGDPALSAAPAHNPASVDVRPSLVVLPPREITADRGNAWIGVAVAEMLTTELAIDSSIRLLIGDRVHEAVREVAATDSTSITPQALTRLSHRLQADYVVTGNYARIAGDKNTVIRLDLRLFDARTGELLETAGATGTVSQLFDVTLRASETLRVELLGQTLPAAGQLAVRAVLPADPEAARLYSEALIHLQKRDALAARQQLEKALKISPRHPLLHSALAEALATLGYKTLAADAAGDALRNATELPAKLQQDITARAALLDRRFPEAIAAYSDLVDEYPDELEQRRALASTYLAQGALREALVTLTAAKRLPSPLGDDPSLDLALARVYHLMGRYRDQQELASSAAERSRLVGAKGLLADATLEEALAWQKLGDSEAENRATEAARALYEELGHRAGVARCLQLMANARGHQGDLDGARQLNHRALVIYRDIGYEINAAGVLSSLGGLSADQGDFDAARRFLDESVEIYRGSGNRLGLAVNLLNNGYLLQTGGDLDGAFERYTESLSLFGELGAKPYLAMALTNIGEILFYRGELERARSTHQEALAINRELGDAIGIGHDTYRIGEVLAARGDYFLARARYEEAMETLVQAGDARYAAEARLGLARVALAQSRFEEAEALARQALQVLRGEGVELTPLAGIVLAESLLAQGRAIEARSTLAPLARSAEESREPRIRWLFPILEARLAATVGEGVPEALDSLQKLAEASLDLPGFSFEARLAAGEIILASGQEAESGLQNLAIESATAGFGDISVRASRADSGSSE